MENLTNFLSNLKTTNPEINELILGLAKQELLKKDTIVANTGEVADYFYIITKGYGISYIVDDKGKEFVRRIFTPYTTMGSLNSLITKQPSKLTYKCVTECEAYKISFSDFTRLTRKLPIVFKVYNEVLEKEYLFLEQRVLDLSLLNATQRYLKLKEEIPNIENVLPQYHIASYLNVSAVQLSRLRRDLLKK